MPMDELLRPGPTPVRFLHTADWQLGHWPGQVLNESRAQRLYEARFEAVQRLARLAREYRVDFVLVAGDVLDDPTVGHDTLDRLLALLREFAPVPVYLIPGNHDPLAARIYQSRWFREGLPEHVHVFLEPEILQIGGRVALAAVPVRYKQDPAPPLGVFEAGDFPVDAPFRIGLAHGTLMEAVGDRSGFAPELPIRLQDVDRLGLHYLALGHHHGWRQFGRAVYPGTPEATGFGEREPGYAALVTLTHPDQEPRVERLAVGQFRWQEQTLEAPETPLLLRQLEELLEEEALDSHTLLRLRVRVEEHDPALDPRVRSLRRVLENRVFYLDWQWEVLRRTLPRDFYEQVAHRFPEGRELLDLLQRHRERLITPDPLMPADPLRRPTIHGLAPLPDPEVLEEAQRVLEQAILDLLEGT